MPDIGDGTTPRVALVTGAARRIGRAVAGHLLRQGWRVALLDHDDARLATIMDLLGTPQRLLPLAAEIGDEKAVRDAIARTRERFDHLDAIVSNAGIMVRKPVTELDLGTWQAVLRTNLTAAFLLAKHGSDALRASRGAFVSVASTRAHMSERDTEAYAASKGGLVALTHALAISLEPEVRVNCVSPGWIHTEGPDPSPEDHAWHPTGRVGRPADVAEAVAWLLDAERSGFVTGTEIVVDGGVTRKMVYP